MSRGTIRGQLLGRTQVEVDGHVVERWPRPAARRLVVLLLLTPGHHLSRDVIAERLFSHLEPSKATRALSKALSQARSVLDDGGEASALEADLGAIWLSRSYDVHVDLTEHVDGLRHAIRAIDAEDGVARLRHALASSPPALVDDRYEDWAVASVTEVERVRRDARLALAQTSRQLADWQEVAAHDPANEEACAALVTAHLADGRRQDAARAFAACRDALADLGLAPDPELAALVDQPPRRGPSAEALWPLFGRDHELSAVRNALSAAEAGQGQVAIVTAAAGMGKTHLLRHLVALLEAEGWLVAAGTSSPQDRLAPFAALRSALEPVGHAPTTPWMRRVLRPAAPTSPASSYQPAELAAMADALRNHLDQISLSSPVLLCLDDLHWADRGLQAVIGRLASGSRGRRWSLLLAARTDEPGAPVPPLPSAVFRLPLAPLSEDASRHLAEHALVTLGRPSERAEEIVARGQGHPFFIVELARASEQDPPDRDDHLVVPERIIELLRHRLAACSPGARRLTALIAVAGEDATIPLVLPVSDRILGDGQLLADVLDELSAAHLVDAGDDGLRLVHPLLRDAAESTINPVRRAQLHDVVASSLTDEHHAADGSVMLAVARHRLGAFAATGTADHAAKAAPAALAAGAISRELGATHAAAQLFEGGLLAFEHLDAPRRLTLRHEAVDAWIGLGQVRVDLGDYELAQRAFEAALGLAADADERAVCWRWLSHVHYRRGDLESAIAVAEEALLTIPDDAVRGQARLLAELGWARYRTGCTSEALADLARGVAYAEEDGEPVVLAQCLDRYAFVLAQTGQPRESLPLFDRALVAVIRGNDSHEEAIVRMHSSVPLYQLGRYDEAVRALDEAAALCDHHGYLYTRSTAHWGRAMLEAHRGDLAAALTERDAERHLLELLGNDRNLAICQSHRAELLRELGRDGEADDASQAAREAAERSGDRDLTMAVSTGGTGR